MDIPKKWKKFFKLHSNLIQDIWHTLDNATKIYPPKDEIFEMFNLLGPKDIRLIIISQSPYQDSHACGIPFLSRTNSITKSLKSISMELQQEYPYIYTLTNPNKFIKSWIKQGVFMINMSMTTGPDNNYTSDHSVLWEEFIREFVNYVDVPVVLMGSLTWTIDAKISIKVPHPIPNNKFIGCDVFIKANQYLDDPILWLSF